MYGFARFSPSNDYDDINLRSLLDGLLQASALMSRSRVEYCSKAREVLSRRAESAPVVYWNSWADRLIQVDREARCLSIENQYHSSRRNA